MDKQIQEVSQIHRGRMFRQDNARPKEKRILVLKTGIAGLRFNIENEAEQKALDEITPGTELILYREPENAYDKWAIAVHLTENDKLGFITRFKNEAIARLMDAGKKFVAVADSPENDVKNGETEENLRNRQAPTEDMSFPISVYFVEEE